MIKKTLKEIAEKVEAQNKAAAEAKNFIERPLNEELKSTKLFGIAAVAVFLLIGIIWSQTASLSSAVISTGVVGVEGSRKTIQHLEGGIIGEILVKEGDRVKAGDFLIILDDTRSLARVEELLNTVRTFAAQEARLRAERAGEKSIQFDHPLLADIENPDVKAILVQQTNQFETRIENLENQKAVLSKRISQLNQQTVGLQKQLTGTRTQLSLIQEEVGTVKDLVEKGFATRPRLLALQRAEADLVATEGEYLANIARNQEAIGETELRIINLTTEYLEEVDAFLTEAQARRAGQETAYYESRDELKRTSIVSPVAGLILNLKFKTVGGVIRAGEPILDIVPEEEELIINAKVRPQDIDDIREGMTAYVVFPSYQSRYLHRISAKVIMVSADALVDSQSQESYFLAKIRVNSDDLKNQIQEIEMTPGMPAEVYITTAERTFFQYLFQPIQRTFERAMREK